MGEIGKVEVGKGASVNLQPHCSDTVNSNSIGNVVEVMRGSTDD